MAKVFFRVDSGDHIGSGHLMRSLHLARAFYDSGHEIHFITRNHKGSRHKYIPKDFSNHLIENGVNQNLNLEDRNNYQLWLGEPIENDLEKTNSILVKHKADLIVIDHYAIDSNYEKSLNCPRVFVIDDFLDRKHYCHYYLNQNLHAQDASVLFVGETHPITFKGPKFALMDKKYNLLRKKQPLGKLLESVENILVFFGGSDVGHDTLKFVQSLDSKYCKQYKFSFILSNEHSTYQQVVTALEEKFPNYKLHNFVEDMPSFMLKHELFIGAGGSTSWERAALGIPSIIISVAENQNDICRSVHKNKISHYIENMDSGIKEWNTAFKDVISNLDYLKTISSHSYQITEGLGAQLVAQGVMQTL